MFSITFGLKPIKKKKNTTLNIVNLCAITIVLNLIVINYKVIKYIRVRDNIKCFIYLDVL